MKSRKKVASSMTDFQINEQAVEVLDDVRMRGDPKRMSKENWRDFLRVLIDELSGDFDAVEEDLRS